MALFERFPAFGAVTGLVPSYDCRGLDITKGAAPGGIPRAQEEMHRLVPGVAKAGRSGEEEERRKLQKKLQKSPAGFLGPERIPAASGRCGHPALAEERPVAEGLPLPQTPPLGGVFIAGVPQ